MNWIEGACENHLKAKRTSFHTPGHKGRGDLLASILFPDHDLTELPGLDMLHAPQGVIAQAQRAAARVYGAEDTFFLVNGASAGNHAMLLSLPPEKGGPKVWIDRRAHRSVANALVLSGALPQYIRPIIHPDFLLPLGLENIDLPKNGHSVKALLLTEPSYYGTLTGLKQLIHGRDQEAPDLPILVDQAHGAHFWGEYFPESAVTLGADLVVHSTHKTLAALTQGAMLHRQGRRISASRVQQALEVVQTSSPSYLVMSSLERAIPKEADLEHWSHLKKEVLTLQQRCNGPLRILTEQDVGHFGIQGLDWSKILVNVSQLGIEAPEAVHLLRQSYGIEPELSDQYNILFIVGIGNQPQDIKNLTAALLGLVQVHPGMKHRVAERQEAIDCMTELPPIRMTPREAWKHPKKAIPVAHSLGEIAGETISIYPPGTPLVQMGEEITPHVRACLLQVDKYRWQGWSGYQQGLIQVTDSGW